MGLRVMGLSYRGGGRSAIGGTAESRDREAGFSDKVGKRGLRRDCTFRKRYMRFDSTPYYHVGEPYYAIGWDALMSEVREEAQLLEDAGLRPCGSPNTTSPGRLLQRRPEPTTDGGGLNTAHEDLAARGPGHGPSRPAPDTRGGRRRHAGTG